jgi:hypothetical protein
LLKRKKRWSVVSVGTRKLIFSVFLYLFCTTPTCIYSQKPPDTHWAPLQGNAQAVHRVLLRLSQWRCWTVLTLTSVICTHPGCSTAHTADQGALAHWTWSWNVGCLGNILILMGYLFILWPCCLFWCD